MAERRIINQAEIAAAERARAAQTAAKGQAQATINTLSKQMDITSAERLLALSQGKGVTAKKLSKEATGLSPQEAVRFANVMQQRALTVQSDYIDPYYSAMGTINEPLTSIPAPIYADEQTNAILEALAASLAALGLEGLGPIMAQIRREYPDISSADALMLLKFDPRYNKPYMTRFAGNKALMDAGFAPLDDREYLANEAAYSKIFTAYGISQFANRAEYARQIGNRVAPEELAEKVSNTYERVVKGAADTVKAITQLYPELTDKDLLGYALDPTTQLPALKRKIQAAEIGGAALAQSLTTGLTAATQTPSGYSNVVRKGLGVEELIAQGVDLQTARRGYQAVAEVLPTAEKLSAIYGGRMDQYGRLQAEQEVFQELASARRARERLTATEIAAFSGEAGVGRGALGRERFV
jgi:hypothetical protein